MGPARHGLLAWDTATRAARIELHSARLEARRPRPQRILTRSLTSSLFPDSFPSLLARRIHAWLPHDPQIPVAELGRRWEELRSILDRSPPSWAWAHIKTLSGGWTTSARIPSATECQCLFGCQAPDSFQHYLVCPRLLHLLAYPRGFLPACPLTRLGLGPVPDNESEYPRQRCHHIVVLSFHIYHKLKADLAGRPRAATPTYHYEIRAAALDAMRC